MNGPEHYREAERLLANLADAHDRIAHLDLSGAGFVAIRGQVIAEAQVHATLALAAATAVPAASAYDGDEDHSRSRGWAGVA